MISKAQISFIKSIHQKKFRQEYQLFLAEGDKLVAEIMDSAFIIDQIYCTENKVQWLSSLLSKVSKNIEIGLVSEAEMERISMLKSASDVLAIVKMPKNKAENLDMIDFDNQMTLVLDDIKDPGNLGTIIRIADWFGFKNIVCSENCVEIYNPKVIQASMGSAFRVNIKYGSIADFISTTTLPVFGALLSGTSCYESILENPGILIIGNEGKGISPEVAALITHPITIPKIGLAESLNAGVACGILLSIWQK